MSWKTTTTQPPKLKKEFVYNSFVEALAFVNTVGQIAEEQGHHPDIYMHDYKKVTITTYSHDVKAITDRDHVLTQAIDSIK